jgi:hypothetical protein
VSVLSYGVLADLADFIADHRPHGSMTVDATEPVWNGYLLTVVCACGVVWCSNGGSYQRKRTLTFGGLPA